MHNSPSNFVKNLKNEQVFAQVGFIETLKMIIYTSLDIFKCCLDKESSKYYEILQKSFTEELSCESIFPKIETSYALISKLLDRES